MYRTPEWKLKRDFINPGWDELYDLKNDPGETTNLYESTSTEAQQVKATLNAKIKRYGISIRPLAAQNSEQEIAA